MLPESARTAAAYLGGGIARGIEQKGAQVARAGMQAAESASSGVGQKVGQFLQNMGSQAQQFGASVGTKGAMKKRDLGLAAIGAGMTGAFVGGMGANSGINALMGYQATNLRNRPAAEPGMVAGNVMPQDLQTSYIALNQPGSPLGMQQMRLSYDVKTAQERQRMLRAAMGAGEMYSEEQG